MSDDMDKPNSIAPIKNKVLSNEKVVNYNQIGKRTITKLNPLLPILPTKKRVAAYARVSSAKDAMLHSLSAQVSYYSELIQNNAEWEYVGVYVDEAKTGTKDTRLQFKELISECRLGKIDMIITKSISRFARNTLMVLETVRELKNLGIDVYFEKENIHSMSGEGELMLTLLSSFAQEESLSVSENCKWRIRDKFRQGIPSNFRILGYKFKDNILKIVPQEAEIIKTIFKYYLDGLGTNAISKELINSGYETRCGALWSESVVKNILKNEKYVGDLLLQKTFSLDHINKKRRKNKGQLPQYYVHQNHEPIIDRATFEKVQKEMKEREGLFESGLSKQKNRMFTGMVVCGVCGKHYRRKITAAGTKYEKAVWICRIFNTYGKSFCPSQQVPEDVLIRMSSEALQCQELTESLFREQIKQISVLEKGKLEFIFNDGFKIIKNWEPKSRSESWTPEMRQLARERSLGLLKRSVNQ